MQSSTNYTFASMSELVVLLQDVTEMKALPVSSSGFPEDKSRGLYLQRDQRGHWCPSNVGVGAPQHCLSFFLEHQQLINQVW